MSIMTKDMGQSILVLVTGWENLIFLVKKYKKLKNFWKNLCPPEPQAASFFQRLIIR